MPEKRKIKPTIISVKGKPHLVVISYRDYEEFLALEKTQSAKTTRKSPKPTPQKPAKAPVLVQRHISRGASPVKAWRLYRLMTQTQLAARAGVSNTIVSLIENKVRKGSADTLATLANALDVTVESLTEMPNMMK